MSNLAEVDPVMAAQVGEALRRVYDPCSLANGTAVNVLEMGLVRACAMTRAGEIEITFCVTSVSCTMAPHFLTAAEREVGRIPGVVSVTTRVDASVLWTEEMMAPEVRERVEQRRRALFEALRSKRRAVAVSDLPKISRHA